MFLDQSERSCDKKDVFIIAKMLDGLAINYHNSIWVRLNITEFRII